MERRWLIFGFAMVLIVGILAPALLHAQSEEVVVSLEGPDTVAPGETFIVRVNLAQVTDIDVAGFRVVFDPAVLAIADTNPGADITDGDIRGAAIPVVGANRISSGTVYVLLNVTGIPGVTGDGYLAEIRFRAVGAGDSESTIGITDLLLGDNTAQEIPSRFAGPLTVTVTSSDAMPRSTPVPVAQPTAAPATGPTPVPVAQPTAAPATRPTPVPVAQPTAAPPPPPPSEFPVGAVIGIVVVAVAVAAAAIGGVLYLVARRRSEQ